MGAGLVVSLGHPGGNVTGLSGLTEIGAKQLQILREIIPGKQVIGVLLNPDTPYTALFLKEIRTAAVGTRTSVRVLEARTADQVPRQFEAAITAGVGGVLVVADPLIYGLRAQIPDLSAKARIPAMYPSRDFIAEGGLMSYGFDRRQIYRRAAEYVDKILKGSKPADLPVEQPTAAKTLGLTIPPSLLQRADQLIE